MMGPPFFRVEHLSRRFGGLLAVNDVTFELRRDQIVGLIGPNGAGKTTLLRLITRVLKPDAGRVTFNGEDITPLRTWDVVNRGIACTFQNTRPFSMGGLKQQQGNVPITARRARFAGSDHQTATFCFPSRNGRPAELYP